MTQITLPATQEENRAREAALADAPAPKQLDDLHTEHGDTTIADQVVQKIAGVAAREVTGVYAMGSAAGRAISNLSQRIPGSRPSVSGGVSVEKGERQTAVDVSIVVEYGVSIPEVSQQIRDSIITAVEYATGLEVVEVSVNVTDVHLPEDEDDDAVRDQQQLA